MTDDSKTHGDNPRRSHEGPREPVSLKLTRRAARMLGRNGGFLLTLGLPAAACIAAGIAKTPATIALAILTTALVALCALAHRSNLRGESAVHRLSQPAAQTGEERRLRQRFGLRDDSDSRTVRSDFAERMKAWHSDAGIGGVDMDEVKQARNRLFHLVSARQDPYPANEIVAAWRADAGWLGSRWGALFPSDRLSAAARETGLPLPR